MRADASRPSSSLRIILRWAALGSGLAAFWVPILAAVGVSQPWHFFAWCATGGALCSLQPARRALAVASAVAGLAILLALATPVLDLLADALVTAGPPAPADAIVALSAGAECRTGALYPKSRTRLARAVALFRAGYAPNLVVSDGQPTPGPAACPLAVQPGFRWAVAHLPAGASVSSLGGMQNTAGEAAGVAALARVRGWRRVMVVTSPTHTRRACRDFVAAGVKVVCVAATTRAEEISLQTPLERLLGIRAVEYEYAALLVHALSGQR